MRITKFSQIPEYLDYPKSIKGQLSKMHSEIVTAVVDKHCGTIQFLKQSIQLINTLSYKILEGDEYSWTSDNPLDFSDLCNDIEIRPFLVNRNMYVSFSDIIWEQDGIEKIASSDLISMVSKNATSSDSIQSSGNLLKDPKFSEDTQKIDDSDRIIADVYRGAETVTVKTPKEDLYIQSPRYLRFDVNDVYMSKMVDGEILTIYTSLPKVPTKQCEISVTTDINKLTSSDLRRLFPNQLIQTRASVMYEMVPGLELHPVLGLILPIKKYSREELIDNLIKYPHLHRLTKLIDGQIASFYTTMEIDGELQPINKVWATLPESKVIPYTSDFIKEYVARRYLLERDIDGIEHKYKLFGELDPYLTLFTTIDGYLQLGEDNPESLALKCVKARVAFKQSRNPVIRRIQNV